MRTVYICSPFRAKNEMELDRNIEYAQELTRKAIQAGFAPITPHLYMTQCLNERDPGERAAGMAAGQVLLERCDFVLVGMRYGISEGMRAEIEAAAKAEIQVMNAEKLRHKLEYEAQYGKKPDKDYAKPNTCRYCQYSSYHTCTGGDCEEPYQRAYEHGLRKFSKIMRRNYYKGSWGYAKEN